MSWPLSIFALLWPPELIGKLLCAYCVFGLARLPVKEVMP